MELVPLLLSKLRLGCIRYMSDTLPVVCTTLGGSPADKTLGSKVWNRQVVELHTATARALCAFVENTKGTQRIERWRGMILSAVATAWVNGKEDTKCLDTSELMQALRDTIALLRVDGGIEAEVRPKR